MKTFKIKTTLDALESYFYDTTIWREQDCQTNPIGAHYLFERAYKKSEWHGWWYDEDLKNANSYFEKYNFLVVDDNETCFVKIKDDDELYEYFLNHLLDLINSTSQDYDDEDFQDFLKELEENKIFVEVE